MRSLFTLVALVALAGALPAQAPARAVTPTPATAHADQNAPTVVRALYVNRWASQSKKRMAKLIAAADETEINAFVIDMKDEFGLNYRSANPEFEKNAGSANVLRDVHALLDTLKAHKI